MCTDPGSRACQPSNSKLYCQVLDHLNWPIHPDERTWMDQQTNLEPVGAPASMLPLRFAHAAGRATPSVIGGSASPDCCRWCMLASAAAAPAALAAFTAVVWFAAGCAAAADDACGKAGPARFVKFQALEAHVLCHQPHHMLTAYSMSPCTPPRPRRGGGGCADQVL